MSECLFCSSSSVVVAQYFVVSQSEILSTLRTISPATYNNNAKLFANKSSLPTVGDALT